MRCQLALLIFLAALLPLASPDQPAAKPAPPRQLENITLDDLDGRPWTLHNLKDIKALVLYFTGTECPLANRYIERVNLLSATFVRKGVMVLAVNSNGLETIEQIRRHQKETGLAVNVLLDREQRLADQLQVETTPTVIVVDASWRVRYRGLFDDSKIGGHVKKRYAYDAVAALVDGRDVPVAETEPWGCMIQRAPKEAKTELTYAKDIAPLLARHCVGCHLPGGDAPFPLATYDEARRWAGTMKVFTRLQQMPPWKPRNQGAFHGERFLPAAEAETLARWADGGMPPGDLARTPPLPKFPTGWALGQPDLVLTAPEFEIGGHGDDPFRCFVLPTNLPADRWLRAIEVKPGNNRVVHHVSIYVDATDAAEKLDAADPLPGYKGTGAWPGFVPAAELDGWAPGKIARPLPDGVGWRLPARSRIVLEVHYHPTGRPEKDQTQVGLYFAAKVDQPVHTIEVANRQLRIPADAKRHRVTAEHQLAEDVHALAVRPHMHHLGREIKVEADYPDGSRKLLLHIPDWDFHWQETYWFQTPLPLPRGTRLRLEAIYDNSTANPSNPNIIPKAVSWGNLPTDEMCLVSFTCVRDGGKQD